MSTQTCVKVLFVLFNIFVILSGAAICVGGILLKQESGFLSPEVVVLLNHIEYKIVQMGHLANAVVTLMMVTGPVICVVALMGTCGALWKIRFCLVVHVFIIIFLLVAEGVLLALWVNYSARIDEWMEGEMFSLLSRYKGPQWEDDISAGWNRLFMDAECCGVNDQPSSPTNDFSEQRSVWYTNNGPTEKVPATCCEGVSTATVLDFINSTTCTQTPQNYFTEGCYQKLRQCTKTYSLATFIGLGVVILVQVVNVLLSCIMVKNFVEKTKNSPQVSDQSTPRVSLKTRDKQVTVSKTVSSRKLPQNGVDTVLRTQFSNLFTESFTTV